MPTKNPKRKAATLTMSPPSFVQGVMFGATTPQTPVFDWCAKQTERLERFKARVAKVLRRWKQPKALIPRYPAMVKRCFDRNESDVSTAQSLVDAQKASDKAKKKWWKPRPMTDADARIARKFAKCKVLPLFK